MHRQHFRKILWIKKQKPSTEDVWIASLHLGDLLNSTVGELDSIPVGPVSHSVALDTGYLGSLFKAYLHFFETTRRTGMMLSCLSSHSSITWRSSKLLELPLSISGSPPPQRENLSVIHSLRWIKYLISPWNSPCMHCTPWALVGFLMPLMQCGHWLSGRWQKARVYRDPRELTFHALRTVAGKDLLRCHTS